MMIGLGFLAAAAVATSPLYTIGPEHRIVEGIATDGRTVWLSSVVDREILECRKRCRKLSVLPPGLHPLGIEWDSRRQFLWVTADCPQVFAIPKCDQGALLALDRKGQIRLQLRPSQAAFHPGDVSAAAGGDVFVSDSANGAVYHVAGSKLQPLVPANVGRSAQGSALTPDGKELVVADYAQGITKVPLDSSGRLQVPDLEGRLLKGIDGLRRCGRDYYGIYNGGTPARLVKFTIIRGRLQATTLIEGEQIEDPTQIASDSKRLLIVGKSGWALADKTDAPAQSALIVAVPIRSCSRI